MKYTEITMCNAHIKNDKFLKSYNYIFKDTDALNQMQMKNSNRKFMKLTHTI